MKETIKDKDLVTILVIGLVITFFTIVAVTNNFSNITGMVTRSNSFVNNINVIYLILFIVITTSIVLVITNFILERKKW